MTEKVVITLQPKQLAELQRLQKQMTPSVISDLAPTMTLRNLATEPEVHTADEP